MVVPSDGAGREVGYAATLSSRGVVAMGTVDRDGAVATVWLNRPHCSRLRAWDADQPRQANGVPNRQIGAAR